MMCRELGHPSVLRFALQSNGKTEIEACLSGAAVMVVEYYSDEKLATKM